MAVNKYRVEAVKHAHCIVRQIICCYLNITLVIYYCACATTCIYSLGYILMVMSISIITMVIISIHVYIIYITMVISCIRGSIII